MVNWDIKFLKMAKEVATWSKDPSSQIGSICVGSKREILATGYNGFPRGIADTIDRLENRTLKYHFVVHAEMNVIYNATYNGVSLDGATMYVHGLPICSDCAKGIIQVGIKRVVMPQIPQDIDEKWRISWALSKKLFREANIEVTFI